MTACVSLLRAINAGGTGMRPMKELQAICVDLGLDNVRTYIQSVVLCAQVKCVNEL